MLHIQHSQPSAILQHRSQHPAADDFWVVRYAKRFQYGFQYLSALSLSSAMVWHFGQGFTSLLRRGGPRTTVKTVGVMESFGKMMARAVEREQMREPPLLSR